VLMQHPSIQNAIAITRAETSGEKRIVAYFVPIQDKSPGTGELQDFLRQMLPVYMMPTVFIHMNGFPLTPNGKIDRKALPVPADIRHIPGYIAPRNKEEQILASIWQDVLDIEQVGINDNFFDLGGASIQIIQIVAKANISGIQLSIENIFEYQTIAGLAAQITGGL
jgi:hypothetical protein